MDCNESRPFLKNGLNDNDNDDDDKGDYNEMTMKLQWNDYDNNDDYDNGSGWNEECLESLFHTKKEWTNVCNAQTRSLGNKLA